MAVQILTEEWSECSSDGDGGDKTRAFQKLSARASELKKNHPSASVAVTGPTTLRQWQERRKYGGSCTDGRYAIVATVVW